jgi:preprotein translocase subunit YajC
MPIAKGDVVDLVSGQSVEVEKVGRARFVEIVVDTGGRFEAVNASVSENDTWFVRIDG